MDWPAADPPIVRFALTSAQRDRLLGSFHVDGDPPFSITATAKGLALVRPFLDPVELVPVSVDRLGRSKGQVDDAAIHCQDHIRDLARRRSRRLIVVSRSRACEK